jgi:hypothetical protein
MEYIRLRARIRGENVRLPDLGFSVKNEWKQEKSRAGEEDSERGLY